MARRLLFLINVVLAVGAIGNVSAVERQGLKILGGWRVYGYFGQKRGNLRKNLDF
jgi:hypothetical protein